MSKDTKNKTNDETPTKSTDKSRRNFLKFGILGAGAAAIAATGVVAAKKMEGIPHEEFPVQMNADFEPISQENEINTFCISKVLTTKYPERSRAFNEILKKEDPANYTPFDFHTTRIKMFKGPYSDTPGYTQLERALALGGASSSYTQLHGGLTSMDSGVGSWNQTMLAQNKYQFENPSHAASAIKEAARLYGAIECGITKRDKRWDYDPMYDVKTEQAITWDKFPFKPKTVIVLMSEMDYAAVSTAPSLIQDATTGNAYSEAIKYASQITIFLRQLGYKAVASLNDLGINAPYAIAAGLGEGGRNGTVIVPKYGPRVRISKVYTDFDFVEYDKPRTYGVTSFCKNCKRCADSCPGGAITFNDPSWGPEYSTDPDYTWHASKGILKFHNDAKKCAKFWIDNDGSCGSCIASCPYNKPDFWHHRLVDAQNVIAPGPMHAFMREMDILFGYGKVGDPDKVRKFWKLGGKG